MPAWYLNADGGDILFMEWDGGQGFYCAVSTCYKLWPWMTPSLLICLEIDIFHIISLVITIKRDQQNRFKVTRPKEQNERDWWLTKTVTIYSELSRMCDPPPQNGRPFADDIFKCIFLNEDVWIPNKISLKFIPKGLVNNIPALVLIMAWRRPGDKPLSELMLVRSLTHICVTRPQWVNAVSNELWQTPVLHLYMWHLGLIFVTHFSNMPCFRQSLSRTERDLKISPNVGYMNICSKALHSKAWKFLTCKYQFLMSEKWIRLLLNRSVY